MKDIQLQKGWDKFISYCVELKDPDMLREFFRLFLTPEERNDIAARVEIVEELLAGKKTQREMAKDLEVSIAKITRGSNMLKDISPNLIKFIKKGI